MAPRAWRAGREPGALNSGRPRTEPRRHRGGGTHPMGPRVAVVRGDRQGIGSRSCFAQTFEEPVIRHPVAGARRLDREPGCLLGRVPASEGACDAGGRREPRCTGDPAVGGEAQCLGMGSCGRLEVQNVALLGGRLVAVDRQPRIRTSGRPKRAALRPGRPSVAGMLTPPRALLIERSQRPSRSLAIELAANEPPGSASPDPWRVQWPTVEVFEDPGWDLPAGHEPLDRDGRPAEQGCELGLADRCAVHKASVRPCA